MSHDGRPHLTNLLLLNTIQTKMNPLTYCCLFNVNHSCAKPIRKVSKMKYSRWLCLLPILFFAVKPAFSQCGGPNIALNKKVAVSHFIHLAEGARAVDGSI